MTKVLNEEEHETVLQDLEHYAWEHKVAETQMKKQSLRDHAEALRDERDTLMKEIALIVGQKKDYLERLINAQMEVTRLRAELGELKESGVSKS